MAIVRHPEWRCTGLDELSDSGWRESRCLLTVRLRRLALSSSWRRGCPSVGLQSRRSSGWLLLLLTHYTHTHTHLISICHGFLGKLGSRQSSALTMFIRDDRGLENFQQKINSIVFTTQHTKIILTGLNIVLHAFRYYIALCKSSCSECAKKYYVIVKQHVCP